MCFKILFDLFKPKEKENENEGEVIQEKKEEIADVNEESGFSELKPSNIKINTEQ